MAENTAWLIVWRDRRFGPDVHRDVIEAPTGAEAKRKLYARLGVKRIVGTNTQRAKVCAECGVTLTGDEQRALDTDVDFVEHGDRGHLIRVEAS